MNVNLVTSLWTGTTTEVWLVTRVRKVDGALVITGRKEEEVGPESAIPGIGGVLTA